MGCSSKLVCGGEYPLQNISDPLVDKAVGGYFAELRRNGAIQKVFEILRYCRERTEPTPGLRISPDDRSVLRTSPAADPRVNTEG